MLDISSCIIPFSLSPSPPHPFLRVQHQASMLFGEACEPYWFFMVWMFMSRILHCWEMMGVVSNVRQKRHEGVTCARLNVIKPTATMKRPVRGDNSRIRKLMQFFRTHTAASAAGEAWYWPKPEVHSSNQLVWITCNSGPAHATTCIS